MINNFQYRWYPWRVIYVLLRTACLSEGVKLKIFTPYEDIASHVTCANIFLVTIIAAMHRLVFKPKCLFVYEATVFHGFNCSLKDVKEGILKHNQRSICMGKWNYPTQEKIVLTVLMHSHTWMDFSSNCHVPCVYRNTKIDLVVNQSTIFQRKWCLGQVKMWTLPSGRMTCCILQFLRKYLTDFHKNCTILKTKLTWINALLF